MLFRSIVLEAPQRQSAYGSPVGIGCCTHPSSSWRSRLTGAPRTSIGPRHRSNGHARNRYHERPISRMGVLVVEADPHVALDEPGLKRALVDEIRRQNAPFGVRIVEATNGETVTDAYNFQAFLGEINLATKVYPDGREERIRGVNFVGTPLNGIHAIEIGRAHV